MYVKAAINGGRKKSADSFVPTTPEEIAQDAFQCIQRGANVVHAHARNESGNESIAAQHVAAMVHATKELDPDIVIGTTTGLWTCESHADRMRLIKSWESSALPDFASITFREEGADEVAGLILDRGMKLESAVWGLSDVPKLMQSPYLRDNERILVEPDTLDLSEAIHVCLEVKNLLIESRIEVPVLFHGFDATFWPIVKLSIEHNVQTRIGFEDTNLLPDGKIARTNLELFEAYYELLNENAA